MSTAFSYSMPSAKSAQSKEPIVAALLSLFPGLGHLYLGEPGRAVLFMSAAVANLCVLGLVRWASALAVVLPQWASQLNLNVNPALIRALFALRGDAPSAIVLQILALAFVGFAMKDAYICACRKNYSNPVFTKTIYKDEASCLTDVSNGSYLVHLSLILTSIVIPSFFLIPSQCEPQSVRIYELTYDISDSSGSTQKKANCSDNSDEQQRKNVIDRHADKISDLQEVDCERGLQSNDRPSAKVRPRPAVRTNGGQLASAIPNLHLVQVSQGAAVGFAPRPNLSAEFSQSKLPLPTAPSARRYQSELAPSPTALSRIESGTLADPANLPKQAPTLGAGSGALPTPIPRTALSGGSNGGVPLAKPIDTGCNAGPHPQASQLTASSGPSDRAPQMVAIKYDGVGMGLAASTAPEAQRAGHSALVNSATNLISGTDTFSNGASASFTASGSLTPVRTVAEYVERLQRRIREAWLPPQDEYLRPTVVAFVVHKDGTVSDVKLVNGDVDTRNDNEALAAVNRAGPFGSFLEGFPEQLSIEFAFDRATTAELPLSPTRPVMTR